MNRVVLIGNGFDLAHNLPTKYEDFINWYWEQRIVELQNEHKNISEDAITTLKFNNDYYNWSNVYFQLNEGSSNWKSILNRINNDTYSYKITKTPFLKIYVSQ